MVEQSDKIIKRARITIMEVGFMTGLVTSLTTPAEAVAAINVDIEHLNGAKLSQSDVNTCIWNFVTAVLRGSKLTDV